MSYAYYEEARLCWFIGAFVATILMSQLAFEEMLRSLFRVANGVGGQISTKKNVNDAGFSDLINQAKHEDLITLEEANALHLIRKSYRNPYVHSHDVNVKPNFSTQEMKIFAPTLVEASVEDEARTTIRILVNLFPKISRRFWGQ
ncbi:MAG: hypothetical protein HYY22_09140 [Thaumarchaeota archaeon]|nr:hypothetical protein [Nitrososphaerota archaeon]